MDSRGESERKLQDRGVRIERANAGGGGRPSRNEELRIIRDLGWHPGLEMEGNEPPPGSLPVISSSRIKKRLAEAQHTRRDLDQQMNTQGLREIR